jgi:Tfp pilus assembly protein PilW
MVSRIINLRCGHGGYSVVELLLAMVISVVILGSAAMVFSSALRSRERESGRTDAITAAQAALSVMSREIGNAGFGLYLDNGLIIADCGAQKLRFRTNFVNSNYQTSSPGEDVMYMFDDASDSVVRFDKNANSGAGLTSGIINRVSSVDFVYYDYAANGAVTTSTTPTANTGKVTINLYVTLPSVAGQPARVEKVSSDITLRNSPYMLGKY